MPATQPDLKDQNLYSRGQLVFKENCLSCHGRDPQKDGPIGPSLFGSSQELIESRVLRLEYPSGYKPKRVTSIMVPMPHLKNDIKALHTYLNQMTPNK